jgi:bacterioferritin (cytochrome b1)
MDRLEFYDVAPSLDHGPGEWPRHDFQGAIEVNYGLETQSAEIERGGYTMALAADDPLTAELFRKNLKSSEASIAEIEAIREVIEQIGLDNYLANQA